MFLSALTARGLHISITPSIVFGILAISVVAWIIFSLIIHYHWRQYGTSKLQTFTMTFFYLGGSALLIGMTLLHAILYAISSL